MRLFPAQDRKQKVLHIHDNRDSGHYKLREVGEKVRDGYRTIMVLKSGEGGDEPFWAILVRKSEKFARIEEWSSGLALGTVTGRFSSIPWGPLPPRRFKPKRIQVTAQADLAMVALLSSCLENICDETFGRNLSNALDMEPKGPGT